MKRILLAFGILLAPALASGQEEGPPLKAQFHQDFRKGDPKSPAVRPIRDGNFVWENGGARVLIPAGQGKVPTTGVSASFRIKGDFEITASYEILKAEKPTEGYGVGVSMFVAIDSDTMHAVSLSRRHMVKGNQLFVADRMKPVEGKPEHLIRVRPAKTETGKLRVKRVGAMVSFLVADGDGAEFVPIVQDAKTKKTDVEFGRDEIRYFQVGGDAGDSEAGLDLRLLDLTVHAEELPGLETAPSKGDSPSPPRPPGSPPPSAEQSRNWTLIGGIAGSVLLLAAVGGGAYYFLRVRKKSAAKVEQPKAEKQKADTKKPVANNDQTAIAIQCKCSKKFKVRAALAGKKIKCPECGASLAVPRSKAQSSDERGA